MTPDFATTLVARFILAGFGGLMISVALPIDWYLTVSASLGVVLVLRGGADME